MDCFSIQKLDIGIFHFSASVRGIEYITGGDRAFQGVSAVINGEVIDQLVQTAKYEVSVMKDQFELSATTVYALSTRERLECTPENRGYAYSWRIPVSMDCLLQIIWSTHMSRYGGSGLLVDELAQVVVKLTIQPPQPRGKCPGVRQVTIEPRIMVMVNAMDVTVVTQVLPKEVDPFLVISMVRMFMRYKIEQLQLTKSTESETNTCQRQLAAMTHHEGGQWLVCMQYWQYSGSIQVMVSSHNDMNY